MDLRQYTASACVLLGTMAAAPGGHAQDAAQTFTPAHTAAQRARPAYSHRTDLPLAERVDEILSEEPVAHAHWGIAVTAMDGTPIYGLEEGKLFRPASTAKLFTTAAAMAILGPDNTAVTQVDGTLDAATGAISGDLVLLGGGDPDFGSDDLPFTVGARPRQAASLANLEELADQLAARGVREVTGDIVGDDTFFPYEPYAQGWSEEDAVWGYGAPVSALSVANNQLLLTIAPGTRQGPPSKPGGSATSIALQQYGALYYTLKGALLTASAQPAGIRVDRAAGSRELQVSGSMPLGLPPYTEHVAIADPAAFAAMAFRNLLVSRGIRVNGTSRARHGPQYDPYEFLAELKQPNPCDAHAIAGGDCGGSCVTNRPPGDGLAHVISGPLGEDVVFTLKTSENLHAEVMLHRLGRRGFCSKGSTVEGARLIRAYLLRAGLLDGDFIFYDGSGLSTKDLVTPRAEAQLLAYAATQPWFAQWKAALPVGGVDGTLASRFTEPPLKGHVFAKTGTLGESRALAGYVQCASGREVIFSILDDDHEPGGSADRVAMDRIVAAIAELN